jgi:uncharacterized membrane protein (DUF4010 family)
VAIPLAAMVVGGLVASLVLLLLSHKEAPSGPSGVQFRNPFELRTAFQFGAILIVVLLISKAAAQSFGNKGVYIAALLGGLTDMDAVTLSMAKLAGSGLQNKVAALAVLIAAASNTVVKAGLALSLGGVRYGTRVVLSFALVLVCGAIAAFLSL